jgi:NAD(P)-dependent dehydrogenase (short-subunit alcohol dehydrogenase family)
MGAQRSLEGKYALVTGGSRGIGRAAVEVLAEAGCNVAITSRHALEAETVALAAGKRHAVGALAVSCDVSVLESVGALFAQIREWSSSRLDILICNAGFAFNREIWDTPLHQTPPEKLSAWYEGVFRTDTMGALFCTYRALPLMMAAGSGSIVYVASTPALEGLQGSPYTVAKAGVLGLMKDVACMYGKHNIRANALALGSILTPATMEVLDEEARKAFAAEAPLKRWGRIEEAAQAMLFLASPQSSFITGQTLVVDGGIVRR